jgi:hypothetical protein
VTLTSFVIQITGNITEFVCILSLAENILDCKEFEIEMDLNRDLI